jgi:hypothetical protein
MKKVITLAVFGLSLVAGEFSPTKAEAAGPRRSFWKT